MPDDQVEDKSVGFIAALKAKGFSDEKMKAIFEAKDFETDEKYAKPRELIERHRNLVSDGLDYNFTTCSFFNAVDKAFDYSQKALANVALRELLEPGVTEARFNNIVETWGLKHLCKKTIDPQTKVEYNAIDVPMFFDVIVGLVAAYTKIRWAKLFSDRDGTPVYKYESAIQTTSNHALCEVITNEIRRQSESMGYRAVERDIILPMLIYGYAWSFARTDYFIEKSLWKNEDGKVESYVSREGMLWDVPHPTRVIFDRTAPIQSINSDTGITWSAYWKDVPFSTVEDNSSFFNKATVRMWSPSPNSWTNKDGWRTFGQFYPCTLKFPESGSTRSGVPGNDRETQWYNSSQRRENIQLVQMFDKIAPKDWGLYDADVPIWHRFIYAGDGTLVCITPFAYNPVNCDTYDCDANRERNSSLSMELTPFQDLITNLFTQYNLAINQNLLNVLFVNTEQVPKESVETIRNLANRKLVKTIFIPFKRGAFQAQGNEAGNAFHRPDMPRNDTSQIMIAIDRSMAIMERIVGISAQEVGSAASHQQSSEEIQVIKAGSSTRVDLTGSYVDSGRAARQRATYEAWYEYGTGEIDQELHNIDDQHIQALEKLGFKVDKVEGTKTVKLTGNRRLADMTSFAEARPPSDRMNDEKVAIAMLQAFQILLNNPLFVQYFGPEYLMERFNQVLDMLGLPRDWRFKAPKKSTQPPEKNPEMEAALTSQIMKIVGQVIQQNNEQLKQGIQKEVVEPIGQRFQQMDQLQQQIGQIVQGVAKKEQQVEAAVADQQGAIGQLVQRVQQLTQAAVRAEAQLASPVQPPAIPGITVPVGA